MMRLVVRHAFYYCRIPVGTASAIRRTSTLCEPLPECQSEMLVAAGPPGGCRARLQSLRGGIRRARVVRRMGLHCRMQAASFPTGIGLIHGVGASNLANGPVDAPSQLYCTDCIAVYCSLEALEDCVVDANEPIPEELNNSHDGMNIPLPDAPLLDLLDALVNDRGKVAAAEALGVNYRTLVACHESRRVSQRMRRALEEYRDAADGDGDDAGDIAEEVGSLERRVVALEKENRALRETIEAQAEQLAQLERQIGAQEEEERQRDGNDAFGVDDGWQQQWRPPRREPRASRCRRGHVGGTAR